MSLSAWEAARNILCVRLDNAGDVLMTTPALRALKESAPGRRITLLASPAGAEAARHVPEVDAVIEFDAPWMKAAGGRQTGDAGLIVRLAAQNFDAGAIFTVYSQSPLPAAYLMYLAGIPLRLAHCRENPYLLLTNWVPEREPAELVRHEVRRQLDLVAVAGARTANERLSFAVPRAARERVRQVMRAAGVRLGKPLVLVHPGASAASRRYPAESYARAMDLLARDSAAQIVLTGDASEAPLAASIRRTMQARSHSLAGRLTLSELGALIERADLLVCNNTGPAHIAAALGTPVVDLYALTNPQHAPWQVASRVLYHDVSCRYCYKSACPTGHHACLRKVSPERVASAARELLCDQGAAAGPQPLPKLVTREAHLPLPERLATEL